MNTLSNSVFEAFNTGSLRLPAASRAFTEIPWSRHPSFAGVELKHIVTAGDTGGQFSYHLVRIAPNKCIGMHTHENQLETHEVIAGSGICMNGDVSIPYETGCISIMPAGVPHEVHAGDTGLLLFAKFIPALC